MKVNMHIISTKKETEGLGERKKTTSKAVGPVEFLPKEEKTYRR